jgi:hypothetical protein
MPGIEKTTGKFLWSGMPGREIHFLSAVFSLSLFGILLLLAKIVQPDLDEHILISNRLMKGEPVGHPAFFFLLQLFSFFSSKPELQLFAAFIIFSSAQYLKIILSIRLCETIQEEKASRILSLLIILCQLAIGFILIQDNYVKASLSPNFFHNGTLLLSIPPSLFLLNESFLFLKDENRGRIRRMLAAGILIIMIKPSFLFCWIPVMPVFVLLREGAGKKLVGFLQVSIMLVFLLMLQSTLLKTSNVGFKIIFAPFDFFGTIGNHLRIVLAACFFPITSVLVSYNFWKRKDGLLFALMTVQGLILSFCFYDVINGIISPNMTWQSSIMHYLLLVFGCLSVTDLLKKRKMLAATFLLAAFACHVFSGVLYLRISYIIHSFYF